MKPTNSHLGRTVFTFGVLALVVAGCGKGNGGDGTSAIGGGSSHSLVTVASVDGNDVLVDAKGQTLYSTVAEKSGHIKCVDACTSFWLPVMGHAADVKAASTSLGARLGLVDRPDGGTQLTFRGLPLYTFAEEGAGELKGDGFTDDFQGTHFVWSAATPSGSALGSGGSGSYQPDDSGDGGYGSY